MCLLGKMCLGHVLPDRVQEMLLTTSFTEDPGRDSF